MANVCATWPLITPLEIDQLANKNDGEGRILQDVLDWVRTFLAQPHPLLGRHGTVCPWIPRALELNSLHLAVAKPQSLTLESIQVAVKDYRSLFFELEPQTGESSLFKAIFLIFPEISEENATNLIDNTQRALKPFFTAEGLMIGEFHRRNMTPGLHSKDFFPLRSPYPMLAVRYMVESDIVFLMRDLDPPGVRIRFLTNYLHRLETRLPEKHLHAAREALAKAELDLKTHHHSPLRN